MLSKNSIEKEWLATLTFPLIHTGHVLGSRALLRWANSVFRRSCPISRPRTAESIQSTTNRIRLVHEGLRSKYTRCHRRNASTPSKVNGPSSATPV